MTRYREQLRAKLFQAATQALSGECDLLSACRIIAEGRYAAGLQDSDALIHIVVIESELDDIPGEAVRHFWSPDAYAEKQRQKEAYLALERETLLKSLVHIRDALQKGDP